MSYRSTKACRILMCDASLSLPRFLSNYSRRLSKLWFSPLSSVPEFFRVTTRSANSSVSIVMGKRIIASRLSVTRSLTCKGLLSGIQKIGVMKRSPCKENGVNLQRMSPLKCVLLSPDRWKVISIGFLQ